ncbi:VCBS repeat-containing protein [Algoriphagus aestuarii]|nr:VCBS repeat-containing protein [Algoriphagus aestuarii]
MKRTNGSGVIWIVYILNFLLLSSFQEKPAPGNKKQFELVKYNNPETTPFVGVGLWAWPIPMDFDKDGDMDLLVSCPDKPFNGLYFFENKEGGDFPIFEAPIRIGPAIPQIQISHIEQGAYVTIPGKELKNFENSLVENPLDLYPSDELIKNMEKKPRFNQWKMVDYEGDGDLDVVVGIDDWNDYGWDNAFDAKGNWKNGPLHGYVYWLENDAGTYVNRGKIQASESDIDVYGAPSPNFSDFDGDGDLDLICGEFLDQLMYFENIGSRSQPKYKKGVYLSNSSGLVKMDLQMIIPVAIDWDQDGDTDLVVGDEDGRVALIRHTGNVKDGMPVFDSPVYFRQKADNLKFGALATPVSVDWDQDGDEDLISGNSAGYIAFIENVGGGSEPVWNQPKLLESDGEIFRIQAGNNGSIQGPAEAKWGYTTLSVADWDGDGKMDILYNSIWGKVQWLRNTGLSLENPRSINVAWEDQPMEYPMWNWWRPENQELVTQWRTTPYAIDWNKDGIMDLVMLDHEGYLSFFEGFKQQSGETYVRPGKRIFYGESASIYSNRNIAQNTETGPLRLNNAEAGGSGRRKISLVDYDSDGDFDLLVNSVNVSLFENISQTTDKVIFKDLGPVSESVLAGHTTSPTFVDWNKDGIWEILVGAEDGHFYHLRR